MRKLPTHPLGVIPLLFKIIHCYVCVLPHIVGLTLLTGMGHFMVVPVFLRNPVMAALLMVGWVFLAWFLYILILHKAQAVLLGKNTSMTELLHISRKRYLLVLGSNLVFFGIGLMILLTEYVLNLLFDLVNLHPFYLFLSVGINIFMFVYLYFAVPEIALERVSIFKGFMKSIALVRKNWWRVWSVLALFGLAIVGFEALGVLFTGQHRVLLLTGYQFLLQILFFPAIVTMTLLLLNDLKLRAQEAHKTT